MTELQTRNSELQTPNLAGRIRGQTLPLQRGQELGGERGALAIERGERVRGVELETHLRARNRGAGSFHDEHEIGGFDGALQAIPLRTGNAAQIRFGSATEIEDDEAEIGVTGEEVRGLQRAGGARTPHPEQMRAEIRRQRPGIKTVRAVDQRDALAGLAGDGEQVGKKQMPAAARRGTHHFRDRIERKAAGRLINCRDARGQHTSGRALHGRKALGELAPKLCELFGHGGHAGGRLRKEGRAIGLATGRFGRPWLRDVEPAVAG